MEAVTRIQLELEEGKYGAAGNECRRYFPGLNYGPARDHVNNFESPSKKVDYCFRKYFFHISA